MTLLHPRLARALGWISLAALVVLATVWAVPEPQAASTSREASAAARPNTRKTARREVRRIATD